MWKKRYNPGQTKVHLSDKTNQSYHTNHTPLLESLSLALAPELWEVCQKRLSCGRKPTCSRTCLAHSDTGQLELAFSAGQG